MAAKAAQQRGVLGAGRGGRSRRERACGRGCLPAQVEKVREDAGPTLLIEAVRAADTGEALISPSITVRLLKHLAPTRTPAVAGAAARLSARETEIVRAIARGRTNQEIATELFISVSTVKGHVAGAQTKLGLRNRVEIAAWAWENRLAESADDQRAH